MNLRSKIILWLLPVLIPIVIIIYLNYRAQEEADREHYLRMAALAVQNGAREFDTYIRLHNSKFHIILDELLNYSDAVHGREPGLEIHIGSLLKENTGFSLLAFTDLSGIIRYYQTSTNDITRHLLPRDVTGVTALPEEIIDDLKQLFFTWKSNLTTVKEELSHLRMELESLTERGEKNSKHYRKLQEKLIAARVLSLHPPIQVFAGGAELAQHAGLPFREPTLLFTVPQVDPSLNLTGFLVGVLDWSIIEDKSYIYKSSIRFGGLPNADISFETVAGFTERNLKRPAVRSDFNVVEDTHITYLDTEDSYLIYAHLTPLSVLNTLNSYSSLNSLFSAQAAQAGKNANPSDISYFVATLPKADIEFYSKQLFRRAVMVLLLSVLFLLGVIFLLTERIVSPINKVAKSAKLIGEGNFDQRITTTQQDEIGQLIETFNGMGDRIQQAQNALHETNSQLKAAKERYQLLFDNAPIAIVVSELSGKVVEANRAALTLSGYRRSDLEWLHAESLYKNPEDRKRLLNDLSQNRMSASREFDLLTRQGNDLKCRFTSILMEIDSAVHLYTMLEDISYQRQIEHEKEIMAEKLYRARKMEAIGLMASGVAHDLNNTLTGLVGYPDLLLNTLPSDSNLRKPILTIKESGERASAIVADLLTVARGAASVKKVTSLGSLIENHLHTPEMVHLRSIYPAINVLYTCHWPQATILCSEIHIRKVILNLVTNGLESIGQEGTVRIDLKRAYVDQEQSRELGLKEGEYVLMEVCDDGAGIPPSHLQHIFEPFYTRKEMGKSGTGLGLTVVWNTMQDHDGGISVESNDAQTCFGLYFPALPPQLQEPEAKAAEPLLRGNGEQILIVDDEEVPREIARQMLEQAGYNTTAVCSGEEALLYLKNKRVDLVILDMLMPPGLNGLETYARMLTINPGQKAIIASGFAESSDVRKTLELGASTMVKKPYSMADLCMTVRDVLEKADK